MVNMNAMPQKGAAIFRVDHPNIQIMSEEIMNQIKENLSIQYKIPIKNQFLQDDPDQTVSQAPQPSISKAQPPQPSALGKRYKPEHEISFD